MQVRKRSPATLCIPLPPHTVHVHMILRIRLDSVWVENPQPIPKCSLRNHCIDLLLRQVFKQFRCTQSRIRVHQLET